ncbi:MAG: hypothetical protein ACOYXR_10100 [Nitrospirota bacterium]
MRTSGPPKITANELLRQHGPTGWLIRRLQRYAVLGWVLFGITFALYVGQGFLDTLRPQPVLAVDETGRVLGKFDFADATARTEEELVAASMHFLSNYLSLNSETIYEDYATALNLMGDAVRERTIASIKQDGYLARVQQAKTRSRIEFATGDERPTVVERDGLHATVRLRGRLVVYPQEGGHREQPFDTALFVTATPRTSLATSGIQVDAIRDN